MKYCGIDAKITVEQTHDPKFKLPAPPKSKKMSKWEREYEEKQRLMVEAEKRLAKQTFKSYRDIAKKLKPGESVVVAVTSTGKFESLLGYGTIELDKNGTSFSVPRILAFEY